MKIPFIIFFSLELNRLVVSAAQIDPFDERKKHQLLVVKPIKHEELRKSFLVEPTDHPVTVVQPHGLHEQSSTVNNIRSFLDYIYTFLFHPPVKIYCGDREPGNYAEHFAQYNHDSATEED